MNEQEIFGHMERIREQCDQLSAGLLLARREGRQPTLDEARGFDRISQELLRSIREFPNASLLPNDPLFRVQARETLELARRALASVVLENPASRSGGVAVPRATASRLRSYCMC